MTQEGIFGIIKGIGLPAAYHHFNGCDEPVEPPFIVYLLPGSSNFPADGTVYQGISRLILELYTDKKDLSSEKIVESMLNKHGFFYDKTETYLKTEDMYEVAYEMEVLIDG